MDTKEIIELIGAICAGGIALTVTVRIVVQVRKNKQTSRGNYSPNVIGDNATINQTDNKSK